MDEFKGAIQAALQSNDPIEREQVRTWICEAHDVETLAYLYQLTDKGWHRIEPCLEKHETCQLICRYLLMCIREDPRAGVPLTRYGAAGELEGWIDHLSNMQDTEIILQEVAAAVTDLFLSSDDSVRGAIETGFLEHVLEQNKLRPLFAHWSGDERLKDTWQRALDWGEAHPEQMKGFRERLRALRSQEE
jgi:hypothetical protein